MAGVSVPPGPFDGSPCSLLHMGEAAVRLHGVQAFRGGREARCLGRAHRGGSWRFPLNLLRWTL